MEKEAEQQFTLPDQVTALDLFSRALCHAIARTDRALAKRTAEHLETLVKLSMQTQGEEFAPVERRLQVLTTALRTPL